MLLEDQELIDCMTWVLGRGLSAIMVMQVWDIRNNRCLQTMTDKQRHRPEDALTCLLYDPKEKQLLSGSVLPKVLHQHLLCSHLYACIDNKILFSIASKMQLHPHLLAGVLPRFDMVSAVGWYSSCLVAVHLHQAVDQVLCSSS